MELLSIRLHRMISSTMWKTISFNSIKWSWNFHLKDGHKVWSLLRWINTKKAHVFNLSFHSRIDILRMPHYSLIVESHIISIHQHIRQTNVPAWNQGRRCGASRVEMIRNKPSFKIIISFFFISLVGTDSSSRKLHNLILRYNISRRFWHF